MWRASPPAHVPCRYTLRGRPSTQVGVRSGSQAPYIGFRTLALLDPDNLAFLEQGLLGALELLLGRLGGAVLGALQHFHQRGGVLRPPGECFENQGGGLLLRRLRGTCRPARMRKRRNPVELYLVPVVGH